jgi:hypothetical protein
MPKKWEESIPLEPPKAIPPMVVGDDEKMAKSLRGLRRRDCALRHWTCNHECPDKAHGGIISMQGFALAA